VSTAELNRLELEMLQLLDFQLSVTPEQLVAVLLDAQSGRLVAQMAAAYASACGMMASASLDAAAVLPCMGLVALPHQVPAAASGMSWDAATAAGASACGLAAAAAAAAAAAHSAQHVAAMLHQQQMLQQLAAVQRKRRNSVDMLEGADFRPRAYHRASLEVVAMAQ
jgi:hypothetical protein